jgi:hypothetical protein
VQKLQGREEFDVVQEQQAHVATLRGKVVGDKTQGVITRIKREMCVNMLFKAQSSEPIRINTVVSVSGVQPSAAEAGQK